MWLDPKMHGKLKPNIDCKSILQSSFFCNLNIRSGISRKSRGKEKVVLSPSNARKYHLTTKQPCIKVSHSFFWETLVSMIDTKELLKNMQTYPASTPGGSTTLSGTII